MVSGSHSFPHQIFLKLSGSDNLGKYRWNQLKNVWYMSKVPLAFRFYMEIIWYSVYSEIWGEWKYIDVSLKHFWQPGHLLAPIQTFVWNTHSMWIDPWSILDELFRTSLTCMYLFLHHQSSHFDLLLDLKMFFFFIHLNYLWLWVHIRFGVLLCSSIPVEWFLHPTTRLSCCPLMAKKRPNTNFHLPHVTWNLPPSTSLNNKCIRSQVY